MTVTIVYFLILISLIKFPLFLNYNFSLNFLQDKYKLLTIMSNAKRPFNGGNLSNDKKSKETGLGLQQQQRQPPATIPPPGTEPPTELLEDRQVQHTFSHSMAKKQKLTKTKIQELTGGEFNVAVMVKIVFVEFRNLNSGPMYIVHATDGVDLVQIEAQDKTLMKLMTEIGDDKLNIVFYISELGAIDSKAEYNYGTTNVALRIRNNTKFAIITDCDDQQLVQLNVEEFFMAKLKQKFTLADNYIIEKALKSFKDIKPDSVDAFIKCQVDSVRTPRTIKNENYNFNSIVQDYNISQTTEKGKLSAWNIEAWFLERLLKEAMGRKVIMNNLRFKSNKYGYQFTFGRNSHIKLLDLEPVDQAAIESAPRTLEQLVQNASLPGQAFMNIPLCLLEPPVPFDEDREMQVQVATCTDGLHKAQCFFPFSFGFKRGTDFTVVSAEVEQKESGLLNIIMTNESNVRDIKHSVLSESSDKLPDKKTIPYPPKKV